MPKQKSRSSTAGNPYEMAVRTNDLTEMQRKFVINYVDHGMQIGAAALAAGYSNVSQGTAQLDLPHVQVAVAERRAEYQAASRITKKRVIDGFLEAIDMAKMKADPMVMVAGWREVGRMCGLYEATKSKVEVSVNGKVMLEKIGSMSDEALLRMMESGSDSGIIEGEVRVIDN